MSDICIRCKRAFKPGEATQLDDHGYRVHGPWVLPVCAPPSAPNKAIQGLVSLSRYRMRVYECGCCDASVEAEQDDSGDWVRFKDVEALINKLTEE